MALYDVHPARSTTNAFVNGIADGNMRFNTGPVTPPSQQGTLELFSRPMIGLALIVVFLSMVAPTR